MTTRTGEDDRSAFLRDMGFRGDEGYPSFRPSIRAEEFRRQFGDMEDGERRTERETIIAGRIVGKREAGKKLYFYDLMCENTKIQVLAEKKYFDEESENEGKRFRWLHRHLRRGDVIGYVRLSSVVLPLDSSGALTRAFVHRDAGFAAFLGNHRKESLASCHELSRYSHRANIRYQPKDNRFRTLICGFVNDTSICFPTRRDSTR